MASSTSQKVTTLSRPMVEGISVLDSTFESKDMTIVASSGEKIEASCLQLSVASHYLRFIFSTTRCDPRRSSKVILSDAQSCLARYTIPYSNLRFAGVNLDWPTYVAG